MAEKYLPKNIIYRQKQGFGVPLGSWFKNELSDYSRELFTKPKLAELNIMREDSLQNMLQEHTSGKINHGRRLFTLIVLENWLRQFAGKY